MPLPARPAPPPTRADPARCHRVGLPFASTLVPLDGRAGFALARSFSDPRRWVHSRLLAWVLLPDGIRALVEAGGLDSLDFRLQRAREAGNRVWAELDNPEPLWAARHSCHPLGKGEDPLAAARGLVSTPLRAGLVSRLGDYPFWDAVWIERPSTTPADG